MNNNEKKYDVVGIGSPLLDFIFEVDDNLIEVLRLKKGEFLLIDKDKSREILEKLADCKSTVTPGGSAANTIAGVCSLGGKAVQIGKIGNDEHGEIYETFTNKQGVLTSLNKHDSESTGHAITFITPDFERSFAVHLGAALHFNKDDIEEELIRNSKILHIEGYQLDYNEQIRSAVLHAIEIAKQNNVIVSLDLSDAGVIERNLDFLKELVKNHVDIIFANEIEAKAFTGKEEEEALHELADMCNIAIVKIGEKGSLIKSENKIFKTPINEVSVVNTNGAGDAYAAGILYGIANGLDLETAGKLASYVASLVVSNTGARLEKSLKDQISFL